MTTTGPDPAQRVVDSEGKVDWAKLFAEFPELNPPGYDETVAQMGYKPRRQQVGYPRRPGSIMNISDSVIENQTLRSKRNDLKGNQGLPYPDARKIPQKWDRNMNGR